MSEAFQAAVAKARELGWIVCQRLCAVQETQPRVKLAPRNHGCVGPAVSSRKAKEMPGDPNRCREHARRCAEIARHTASPEVRDHFTSLEQSWLRLAAEIESIRSFSISLVRFRATLFLLPKQPSRSGSFHARQVFGVPQ